MTPTTEQWKDSARRYQVAQFQMKKLEEQLKQIQKENQDLKRACEYFREAVDTMDAQMNALEHIASIFQAQKQKTDK